MTDTYELHGETARADRAEARYEGALDRIERMLDVVDEVWIKATKKANQDLMRAKRGEMTSMEHADRLHELLQEVREEAQL